MNFEFAFLVSSHIVPAVLTVSLQSSFETSIHHLFNACIISAPYFFLNQFKGLTLSARSSTFSLTYHPRTKPKISPIVKNIIYPPFTII